MGAARSDIARKWCVFTSAGDHNNVLSWVAGLEARDWDLIIAFYGDDTAVYDQLRVVARVSYRMQGGKFPNLKKLMTRQPGLFAGYDFIWVVDDDLIVTPSDIGRLFRFAMSYDFWVCQPAYSTDGRVSHPITAWAGSQSSLRIVSFVEETYPLFRKDKLDAFMAIYDGELEVFGIDWWYCSHLQANRNRKLAIIDEIVVTNPHDHQRSGGKREVDRLGTYESLLARWLATVQAHHMEIYDMGVLAQIRKCDAEPL